MLPQYSVFDLLTQLQRLRVCDRSTFCLHLVLLIISFYLICSMTNLFMAVVLMLFIHCLLLLPLFCGFCVRFLFCFAVLCVLSSFAIISLGKRELVALLLLCSECHGAVIVL